MYTMVKLFFVVSSKQVVGGCKHVVNVGEMISCRVHFTFYRFREFLSGHELH